MRHITTTMKAYTILSLDRADEARALLDRIRAEFLPIAQARGYSVASVSEMCCCGDGLDSSGGKRKARVQHRSVLGYNASDGRGAHRIHLRLRDPTNHSILLPYEDVAGTMAHEMAHCVHGNHSAQFYRLMDEISEEHADYLVRGVLVDRDGFPMGSTGHTLGGTEGAGEAKGLGDAIRRAAEGRARLAAERGDLRPRRLGGSNSDCDGGIDRAVPAKEAVRIAAERRRGLDALWCQPCAGVIEMLSDTDEDGTSSTDGEEEVKKGNTLPGSRGDDSCAPSNKRARAAAPAPSDLDPREVDVRSTKSTPAISRKAKDHGAIDLTMSVSPSRNTDRRNCPLCIHRNPCQGPICTPCHAAGPPISHPSQPGWPCGFCTLLNRNTALACSACGTSRWNNGDEAATEAAARAERDDAIELVQKTEIERSEDAFGGFNIYGPSRRKTATMPHLT